MHPKYAIPNVNAEKRNVGVMLLKTDRVKYFISLIMNFETQTMLHTERKELESK